MKHHAILPYNVLLCNIHIVSPHGPHARVLVLPTEALWCKFNSSSCTNFLQIIHPSEWGEWALSHPTPPPTQPPNPLFCRINVPSSSLTPLISCFMFPIVQILLFCCPERNLNRYIWQTAGWGTGTCPISYSSSIA